MYSKSKKIKKISLLSALFVTLSSTTFGLALSSCSNSKINNPSTSASSFTSLFNSVLPTVSGVLSSSNGREEINKTYINKFLSKWYSVVANPEIENLYQDWTESAEEKYDSKYKEYKKNNGKNWKQLFQQDVLDPVGGTKESFILNELKTNFKSTLVDNIFSSDVNNYLGYQQNSKSSIIPISDINKNSLDSLDNKYVNATTVGQKNGFIFSADALDSNDIIRIDYGYADLLNFIMDSWVKNELPLPLSMSLWKNDTDLFQMNQLFSEYFNRNNPEDSEDDEENSDDPSSDPSVSTASLSRESSDDEKKFEPSYNFQFFQKPNINPTNLTTTDKFNKLLTNLSNGSYVNNQTGLIKLPTKYTEDSSTSLITPANSLFDGTYVTPFSAAAWYKFSNAVFNITDNNINVATKIDNTSIMNNFLVFQKEKEDAINVINNNNTQPTGAFMFPYPIQWNNPYSQSMTSVFTDDYLNAIGIIDILNLSDTTTLTNGSNGTNSVELAEASTSAQAQNNSFGNFILVRNTFGVHLIGIDRLSILKQAYNGGNTGQTSDNNGFQQKFTNVCNELRNTFMYYLALDIKNSTTKYGIIDSLKNYFSNNFETILFSYLKQFIDNPQSNPNNLFGPYVTQNTESQKTITYTDNYGFELEKDGKSYSEYCDTLNEIKSNSDLRNLIDAALSYKYANDAYEFSQSINNKIYENQSSYNDNLDPDNWLMNGIAGCLSFTRNSTTGEFTSLIQLVNALVTNKLETNTTGSSVNKKQSVGRNVVKNARTPSLSAGNQNGTTQATDVKDTLTNLQFAKNNYQKDLVTYLNNAKLVVVNGTNKNFVGTPTYIFTNNEYVNSALVNCNTSDLTSIVNNLYRQRYIYPNGKKKTFNDGASTEGSNQWIESQINNAINSTYVIKNFVDSNNVYAYGDWSTQQELSTKASNYFDNNWNLNEYSYTLGNENTSFCSYDSVSDADSYYNLLITLRYLVDYNDTNNQFNFEPLYDFLNEATKITNTSSSKALVGWINQNSILKDSNFGKTINAKNNTLNVSEIQTTVSNDSAFKKAPVLLTNVNSYSWYGALNPYTSSDVGSEQSSLNGTSNTLTLSDITFTTDSNYWISAPMSSTTTAGSKQSQTTSNTGFVGFQFENTSQTSGISNVLPTSVFDNSTYSNLFDNQTNLQYLGMLYSFGSRKKIIDYVNGLSNPFLLIRFYENNLKNSGLPLTDQTKNSIDDIINSSSTETSRFEQLQQQLITVLNDNKQVPDNAFNKMSGLPIWNSNDGESTTLFDSSDVDATGLKNEYVISQFNNDDVNKLLNNNVLNNSTNGGYLGLNPTTFFNAVVMLAQNSTYLKDQAINNMMDVVGKISIYDIRLISIFNRTWIANYDDWKEIQEL